MNKKYAWYFVGGVVVLWLFTYIASPSQVTPPQPPVEEEINNYAPESKDNDNENNKVTTTGGTSSSTTSTSTEQKSCKQYSFGSGWAPFFGPVHWNIIPAALKKQYTLNDKIPVVDWYLDDSKASQSNPYYKDKMNSWIELAKARQTGWGAYREEALLYAVLNENPVKGKSVLVIGTLDPWIEAILIAYGCTQITTVDFNPPVIEHSAVTVISVDQLNQDPTPHDIVISYSSLEHDGLGRYGDPISPNGDLIRMEETLSLIKPDGLFFLTVPMGRDKLAWNAHRVYGAIRYPLLVEKYEVLGMYRDHKLSKAEIDAVYEADYMHVTAVLKKKKATL